MQLSLQNFVSLVETMAAGVQATSKLLLDLSVGSVLRAILEANASIALWMQWLILQVLQTTRAATSTGTDLDSWMADFSLVRLPAVAATGTVTFSRFTPLGASLVPTGALVRTADGSQTFFVATDTTNTTYSAGQGGYLLADGMASFDLPVQAQVSGSAGNVLAGSVTLLATAVPGIDTVSNSAPFANGADAESDVALRGRFTNFLDSRSRATPLAIGYGITSIQPGMQYVIQENTDPSGAIRPGSFVVTVDDGSGSPSASLLATVVSVIEGIRPIGSIYTVRAPQLTVANISLTLTLTAGSTNSAVASLVSSGITAYVNALPIGAALPATRIAQVAYAASPLITNVSQILINGAAADMTPTPVGVVKAGVITVN
jgi:uncharacterized phage protein gp47/JayE